MYVPYVHADVTYDMSYGTVQCVNGIYYDLVVCPYDMGRTFICAPWPTVLHRICYVVRAVYVVRCSSVQLVPFIHLLVARSQLIWN